jgi:L-ascorbate metabolism protein UlaG (beta-lactamase superfamily)
MLDKIFWLGHASVRIVGPPVIYVDPWKLADGAPRADLILVTHEHHDHFSPDDINKIAKPSTAYVAPASVAARLSGAVHSVRPGDRLSLQGVDIRAMPAYNIGKPFHPKSAGHVGYVITLAGRSIYIAGDTDKIPEMSDLKVDVAMLPVGGKYTMTAEEAAQAANEIRPGVAVPMHFGTVVGGQADAEQFRRGCKVPVEILAVPVP